MLKPIHPFPARMAPEVALAQLASVPVDSVVLDPMAGSGTVLRQATELGLRGIGVDTDPLAVLMTKVWTTRVEANALDRTTRDVLEQARDFDGRSLRLPWIDDDDKTRTYVRYWFGPEQRSDLRRIAAALVRRRTPAADLLRVALSRIIVTKDVGASLARDVSHSRPHKVMDESDFEVFPAFERAVRFVRRVLDAAPCNGAVTVHRGDARDVSSFVADDSIDVVLTSPPYLNAIDYMRGHRLSLVWLGYGLDELSGVRSTSIGAESRPDGEPAALEVEVQRAMCNLNDLQPRHRGMTARYARDVISMTKEIARVLRPNGKAVLVVGNSCLKGVFIRNDEAVVRAATAAGLRVERRIVRDLPAQSRYLPMPAEATAPLGKRMRTESILTFRPAA